MVKELILEVVDDAFSSGASRRWPCSVLGVSDDRVHRWRRRRSDTGCLDDAAPGGVALHALGPSETVEVLALVEQWGPADRSFRKLAHRGSYEGRGWVLPSTLRRVLAAQGLILPKPPARDPAPRVAWPYWLVWAPNKIWCFDVTHFPRARRAAFAIVDVAGRRWIDTLVSARGDLQPGRGHFRARPCRRGPHRADNPPTASSASTRIRPSRSCWPAQTTAPR